MDTFCSHGWEWEMYCSPMLKHSPVDIVSELLNDPEGVCMGNIQSRGKGRGVESICSSLYELLEHVVYENPDIQLTERCLNNTRPLSGDVVLDFASEKNYSKRLVFQDIEDGSNCAYLPQEYCGFPSSGAFEPSIENIIRCYYTNNGWASGASVSEATLHAVNELIERDAISLALLNSAQGKSFGVEIVSLSEQLNNIKLGIEEHVHNSVTIVKVPSLSGFVVLAYCRPLKRLIPAVGCGASQYCSYAVYRALLELWQEIMADKDSYSFEEKSLNKRLAYLCKNYPLLCKALQFECDLDTDDFMVQYPLNGNILVDSVNMQINNIISDLRRSGLKIWRRICYSEHHLDCNPSVVQIVVPGLERFHVIRHGFIGKPIGRLRSHNSVTLARTRN
jgi:ribosomal protein S12 methylthiotransferase accessory factor